MAQKGYKTLTEALEGLRQRGFSANFEWLNKTFRAVNNGLTYTADQLTIVEHHRFEGVRDPDDMAVVYAIEARDGSRGTIADAFGPQGEP